MKQFYSFARNEMALRRAASAGTAAAAELLAADLRSRGFSARSETRLDGTATVTLEGAAVAGRAAMGTALAANRARLTETLSRSIADAVSGRRS